MDIKGIKKINLVSILFALITVIIALLDLVNRIDYINNINFYYLYYISLAYFIVEYFVRLYYSKNKIKFILSNKLDLIAIFPYGLVTSLGYVKIFRLIVYLIRLNNRTFKYLRSSGFIYIIYLCIVIILSGAISIYYLEYGITVNSFGDAVWWAFVTATTVGYGDLAPSTSLGRIVASILMITGIGTIGMLTTSISKYFMRLETRYKEKEDSELIEYISNSYELEEDEKVKIIEYIRFLKSIKK